MRAKPMGRVDLAITADAHHQRAFPCAELASVVRALKPGGQGVFVEYRTEASRVPIKPLHKMSEAQFRREAQVHPLVRERSVNTLPWQHRAVSRKRG